jgi:nucleotide-binding universal stress UspA family protein
MKKNRFHRRLKATARRSIGNAFLNGETSMYQPTEIETTTRRTSIKDFRTGLMLVNTPEVALDYGIDGSNKQLLVVIGSEKTETQCLEFARRFANRSRAKIHVVKPMSADPADEVRCMAVALEADWLCMVTHGGPGIMTLFLKSEDEKVLRAAPCPVVCIPEKFRRRREAESTDHALRPVERILVPINSPTDSRNTLAYAVELAEWFRAKVDLLRVEELVQKSIDSTERSVRGALRARTLAHRNELAALAEEVVPKRLRGRKVVSLGLPLFYATIRAMRGFESDLIVLAAPTRRWNAHARIDVGTELILRGAICPVICIPEGDVRACAAPNRELPTTLLRDRREGWSMAERRREGPVRIESLRRKRNQELKAPLSQQQHL